MATTVESLGYEFLRPLTQGWIAKIEAAARGRSKWKEIADECEMFYSKSAAAMWDPAYGKKFWRGTKPPRFRVTINKAFELVAVFGPNLLWDTPTRTVEPKKMLEIPEELLQQNPQFQAQYQQLLQMAQGEAARDRATAQLLERWLNYTPRETPEGGLAGQSEKAVIDALIRGRGILQAKPYKFPGSGRTVTGAFRIDPCDLYIDPDFKSLEHAKWIAIRHQDHHADVEERFSLPAGSMKGKATLETTWSMGEWAGNSDKGNPHRASGQTNDLVVWYEIYSKCGVGGKLTGMDDAVKLHLEQVAGKYAYLAVCADCPYPLNCPTEVLKGGATEEEVKQRFEWPVPLWADDRWPIECLDFYPDPSSAWPIPPLGPAMGELKLLNFLIPWLCNRTYSSMRDFWAIAGPHVDHYRKYLEEGEDQSIIPTPQNVEDVRKAVQILSGPEAKADVWKIIDLVEQMFNKRTGLTEFAYGRNEDGTQNRTAEETMAKARAVGVRPEHMQKKVVAWQSNVASVEGFLARWFVTGQDVLPLMGPLGAMLWQQYIEQTDVELVTRQMAFTVAAASVRRPNRDRDIANYQQVMQTIGPVAQGYGQQTGNYQPWNGIVKKWAEFHDIDLEEAMIPEQDPNDPQVQQQQQMQQLQMQQMAAETQSLQADAQLKISQAQGRGQELQMELAGKQAELQLKAAESANDLRMKAAEFQFDREKSQQEFQLDQAKTVAELTMDQQRHQLDLKQQRESHLLDILQGREQFAQQQAQQRVAGAQQLQQSKQLGQAKVQQTKALAKAKPKPAKAGAK